MKRHPGRGRRFTMDIIISGAREADDLQAHAVDALNILRVQGGKAGERTVPAGLLGHQRKVGIINSQLTEPALKPKCLGKEPGETAYPFSGGFIRGQGLICVKDIHGELAQALCGGIV